MVDISKGIYKYIDLENDTVVYIGKDSNIHNDSRDKAHHDINRYDSQPFNRILQKNPNRYKYLKICEYNDLTNDELNYLEIKEIMKHKFLYDEIPKFNFTIGGEGSTGYRKPIELFVYKIFKHKSGDIFYIRGHDGKHIKGHKKYEKLIPICKALNNREITEEQAKLINLSPFKYTVVKSGKNGFQINGKKQNKLINSKSKNKLKCIAIGLNDGDITEEQVKKAYHIDLIIDFLNEDIDFIPFDFGYHITIDTNGFKITDKKHKPIKKSQDKQKLSIVCNALNNNKITEKQVKSIRGIDKVIELIQSL